MTSHSNNADKLALLFSTDWFRSYWPYAGFVSRAALGDAFQCEMRSLVTAMIGGAATYWEIEFSESRLAGTRDALLEALDKSHASESDLSLIHALVHGRDVRDALVAVSTAFWNDYEAAFQQIWHADLRATEWDRYVADLTPELEFTRDFAFCILCGDF